MDLLTKEVRNVTLSLAAKKIVVQEVNQVAKKALSAVVADYRGLTVNQMTQLRTAARKADVYLRVVPNTLARRAFENTEFACLNEKLVGPLFIALSMEAPSDAARLLKDHVKTFQKLEVKALSVNGVAFDGAHLEAIASLPTRDEALSKLLYVMRAPIEKLVRTIAEPKAKLVRTMVAIKEAKSA
jgi:large subunit ribosomal protein L10